MSTLPIVPERFRVIIEGNSTQCPSRANITPGELGRQMENLLTGQLAADCRGWGLSITVEDLDDKNVKYAMENGAEIYWDCSLVRPGLASPEVRLQRLQRALDDAKQLVKRGNDLFAAERERFLKLQNASTNGISEDFDDDLDDMDQAEEPVEGLGRF